MADVRVRKAMALWIDKQQAVDAVTGGFGIIGGLFNPSNPFTSPDVLTWPGWNPNTKEQDRGQGQGAHGRGRLRRRWFRDEL